MTKIDIGPLRKAHQALIESLHYARSPLVDNYPGIYRQFRAACVQAFEFNYELCVRLIRRYLEITSIVPPEIRALSFNDLLRVAADQGVIEDPAVWFRYRALRNLTSHTYHENVADEVYQALESFERDVEALLSAFTGSSSVEDSSINE